MLKKSYQRLFLRGGEGSADHQLGQSQKKHLVIAFRLVERIHTFNILFLRDLHGNVIF